MAAAVCPGNSNVLPTKKQGETVCHYLKHFICSGSD